ncbi:hypothetical protein C8A03DRAFT_32407 [Achaetomium macrosporum]|uniref:Uncharacterized protein n=1 Tax=Achaetomium macrosporum TaxID=79813 RepID=A0AAN7CCK4_9PEZI|nr:hypothetical protein C8A03DRAFT_32407 [Achaetomium macrosporum]
MIDAAELRRRWTDKTNAVFSPRDRHEYHEYPAEDFEREFDFQACRSIVFLHGERTGRETDVILLTQGSGHMTLPAGVQVLVQSGYAKCEPARGSIGSSGSTVVGGGIRAPPSSRVSAGYAPSAAYARSSADSGYSGSASGSAFARNDAASFMMRGSSGLNFSGSRPSSADSAGDWEVVEEMDGAGGRFRDDACSIAPSESISSVGSRHHQQYRRYTRDY